MIVKFSLDLEIDSGLIAKIKARAGKNSLSKAAKQMMIEWSYFEDMSLKGQKWDATGPLRDHSGPDLGQDENFDLSVLDEFNL